MTLTIGLLIAGATIFLLGMLTGACVLRLRVTKFGNRMLVDIGRPRQVHARPEDDPA